MSTDVTHPLANGHTRAGGIMLQPHLGWLRTVVLSRVGEPEAVDDVLQEVGLACCRGTPPEASGQLAPWLYRVAVRQSLLYRRRAGRRRRLVEQVRQSSPRKTSQTPEVRLVREERQTCVQSALAELPDLDRQILLLKYTEDWTYQQLAEHLGVSITTIEYRLLRARRRLQHLLAAREITCSHD
jgi:RNA polymerase sigma-70 factor (ECF subfamily)